jgi:hypothetical protein
VLCLDDLNVGERQTAISAEACRGEEHLQVMRLLKSGDRRRHLHLVQALAGQRLDSHCEIILSRAPDMRRVVEPAFSFLEKSHGRFGAGQDGAGEDGVRFAESVTELASTTTDVIGAVAATVGAVLALGAALPK